MRGHRRSIRLGGYDYARPGFYFVTICSAHRVPLLCTITAGRTCLLPAGRLVADVLAELDSMLSGVAVDCSAIMPDHIHIVFSLGTGACPLAVAVHRLKSLTTTRYCHAVRAQGWPPFRRRLWQRNYHESVIRGANHLAAVRRYVALNPARWRR